LFRKKGLEKKVGCSIKYNLIMNNSKEQQTQSNRDSLGLTDYHWQRSRDAQKEAEEMLKHPLSLQAIDAQIEDAKRVMSARN